MGVEARASSFPLAERQQAAGSWGTFLLPEIPGRCSARFTACAKYCSIKVWESNRRRDRTRSRDGHQCQATLLQSLALV